jgi:hypothetical protein
MSQLRHVACCVGCLFLALQFQATSVRADEPIMLRYKASPGDKLVYRTTTSMKQTQVIGEMEIANNMTQTSVADYKVDGIGDDGQIQFTIENTQLKVENVLGPLGKYVYDSTANDRETGSVLSDSLNPLYDALSGVIVQAELTPRGEVVKVSGYKELLADLLKDNPLAAQFAGGGSDDVYKLGLADNFITFSDKPVRPGDQWDVPYELPLPKLGQAAGKRSFTYVGPDKVGDRPTVKIEVVHDVKFDLDLDSMDAKVSGTLATDTSSGVAHFDPVSGRLVSYKSKHTLSGTLTVVAGDMTIPVKSDQTQETAIELLEDKRSEK